MVSLPLVCHLGSALYGFNPWSQYPRWSACGLPSGVCSVRFQSLESVPSVVSLCLIKTCNKKPDHLCCILYVRSNGYGATVGSIPVKHVHPSSCGRPKRPHIHCLVVVMPSFVQIRTSRRSGACRRKNRRKPGLITCEMMKKAVG